MKFINPTLVRDWEPNKYEAKVGTPVRRGHIPRWVRDAALAYCRRRGLRPFSRSAHAALKAVLDDLGMGWRDVLDHLGSTTTWDGCDAFVGEPYHLDADDIRSALRLADALGCKLSITATSEWYPTETVRVEFRRPDAG